MKPITFDRHGFAHWTQQPGDKYLATGTDRRGKRFRITSSSWPHINSLNLWQGTKWLVRNGRKHRIQSVNN